MRYLGIETPPPRGVLAIARSVRRRILKTRGSVSGHCGEASQILEERIRDELGIRCYHVCGDFCADKGSNPATWEGHSVVVIGRYILDITGDQFNPLLVQHKQSVRLRSVVFGSRSELDFRYGC